MHIGQTRTFESKEDYINSLSNSDKEVLYRNLARKFPTAKTNIVKINDNTKTAILSITQLLKEHYGQHIGFMTDIHLPKQDGSKPQNRAEYFKALHNHISDKIRSKTGATGRVNYGKWKSNADVNTDSCYDVVYVDVNSDEQDLVSLNAFIDRLDDESDTYHASEQQEMLSALLRLFLKLDHIQHLNTHEDAIADNYINLNNDAYYLIDVEEKEKNKSNLYHTLKPEIWVSSENEIITNVKYQKFESNKLSADIFTSDTIDTVMLEHLPLRFKHHVKQSNIKNRDNSLEDSFKVKQISASEGKRGINYFDKKDLRASAFFYETYLAELMENLCRHAEIDYTHVRYAPQYRGRPFVTLERKNLKRTKIVIINALSQNLLKQTYHTNVAFKVAQDKPQLNPKPIEFTGSEAFKSYVTFLKTHFFQGFDVEVYDITDITYNTLDANTNYLCIQDPRPNWFKGYWVVDNQKTVNNIEKQLGTDWLQQIEFGFNEFKGKKTGVKFEHETLKLLRLYQKAKSKDEPFFTDAYTLLKINQLLAGLEGEQTKSIQGLHSFPLETIGRVLIGHKKFLDNGNTEAIAIQGRKKFIDNHQNILTKIKTDLMLKNVIFADSHLNLNAHDGAPINYSQYVGNYRCYYIKRPRFYKKEGFYASKIDITIDLAGITITNISLADTETSVRRDKDFPISEDVFERLYNDGFYMVDTHSNVLTNYASKRNGRIIASDNVTKTYAGKNLIDYYYEALNSKGTNEANDDWLASNPHCTEKKVELPIAKSNDASFYIPFWTLKSSSKVEDFHYHKSHIEGSASAGMQWLFVEDNGLQGLKTYLTDKNQMKVGVMNKGIGLYNILVKDAQGNCLDTGVSNLASLYIHTTNYNVNKANDFSATSVLHAIAKIALTN